MKLKTINAKLPKFIKRIVILKSDGQKTEDGRLARIVVRCKRKRKRKRQSKGLTRVWERMARRGAKANQASFQAYLDRHRRSNRKRRDGWVSDYGYNIIRASRKGGKKFKLSKIFGW